MKQLSKFIGTFGLAALLASGAAAWDFLYVQHTIERTDLIEVNPIGADGTGSIRIGNECERCPQVMPYTKDTYLTTPFGSNQSIENLGEWQGNPIMVRYSLTNNHAVDIVVYSVTTGSSE